MFHHHLYRLFPAQCPLCLNADRRERVYRGSTQHFIIICHQYFPCRKNHLIFLCGCLFHIQYDVELRSSLEFACHSNRSFHRVHDILCYRHAKPCAFRLLDTLAVRTRVGIKNMLQELRCHADSIVLHYNMCPHILVRFLTGGFLLKQRQLYGSPVRCILDCI